MSYPSLPGSAAVADDLGAAERTYAAVLRAARPTCPISPGRWLRWRTPSSRCDLERLRTRHQRGRSGRRTGCCLRPIRLRRAGPPTPAAGGHRVGGVLRLPGGDVVRGEADQVKGTELVRVTGDDLHVGRRSPHRWNDPWSGCEGNCPGCFVVLLRVRRGSWCEVTLTDPTRPLSAMDQVRRQFPHTLSLQFAADTADLGTRRGYCRESSVAVANSRCVAGLARARPRRLRPFPNEVGPTAFGARSGFARRPGGHR